MELIIKFNKGFLFLLCVIDIYSKYVWAVPLKDEKGTTIIIVFQKILNQSNRKPKKCGLKKIANFKIDQWNNGCRIMI